MILRRLTANLRAQNWTAIAIDFGIVVIGVFLGIQASNWNQGRLERRETRELLHQLSPELRRLADFSSRASAYYGNERHYAETAFGGWRNNPNVSDRDFIVGAYQASQVMGMPNDGQSWALVFGGDELRKIDDVQIRAELARLMTYDYTQLSYRTMETPYRQDVRQVIPDSIQQRVREACGDIQTPDFSLILPARCRVDLPPDDVAKTAADLRAHPQLVRELDFHLAQVSTFLGNLTRFEQGLRGVKDRIDRLES
jgi:hypothetical protein